MINFKNAKSNLTLLSKGISITCIASINALFPLNISAQELNLNCINFWTNPNTGENECFSSKMTLIAEPTPVLPLISSSPSEIYNIGGQPISVPDPTQYVRVTPKMDAAYRLYTSTKDPYHKLLASYISKSDEKMALRGEIPASSKGFYLKVLKDAENESTTPQDFAKIKNLLKNQNQEAKNAGKAMLQEIVKESGEAISKELGVDLSFNVSQMIPLDSHYESEDIFSYSVYLVGQVSAGGVKHDYVKASTVSMVNLSGKVVSLYSFGEKADLEWTRKVSRAWAEKAVASNP